MSRRDEIDILISEVGPREGQQSVSTIMPTELKLRWVNALAEAGLREIEVGSFVSPKHLPQMADTAQVVNHALKIDDLNALVLVPNLRGATDALNAGALSLSMPISASTSHSMANIGMTPYQAVEQVRLVAELMSDHAGDTHLEVGMSTAFGCATDGNISEDWVIELAEHCAAAGAHSVGLSDTSGSANPAKVRRLFTRLKETLGERSGAAHFHNTRGQGLANVVAALDVGVTAFDSSHGGLGGCPYAPGASGNIVTEDLVYLLESMGLRTGVDIDMLVKARSIVEQGLPGEPLYGLVPDAGVHTGFAYAVAQGGTR